MSTFWQGPSYSQQKKTSIECGPRTLHGTVANTIFFALDSVNFCAVSVRHHAACNDLQILKQRDTMRKVIGFYKKEAPELYSAMIGERDKVRVLWPD